MPFRQLRYLAFLASAVLLTAVLAAPAWAVQKTQATKRKKAARKTSSTAPAKASLRTVSTRRSAARRPRTNWRETIDRASKGNSAQGDDINGEDMTVRMAALDALGPLNGTVLVTDPKNGRILSIVNQRLAFSNGEQPCSTIKLSVALAALNEGLIDRETQIKLSRRSSMNLTEAIAHSNNPFFERLGSQMGFEKVTHYATEFGFGEPAGYHIPEEQSGTLPARPPSFGGVARMSSFGQEISVTPLELAAFVSAVGNGGTLFYLQRPRTPEEVENFQPMVKRQLEIQPVLADLREGMAAAVLYGTGRRAQNPFDVTYGKTGTCSHNGSHLGWFASYSGSHDPRLSVVVLLRGGHYAGGAHAAQVAGKVYKNLYERNYPVTTAASAPTQPVVVAAESASEHK
jgi:cell division protein FtsI/penicillin-binding protein 2